MFEILLWFYGLKTFLGFLRNGPLSLLPSEYKIRLPNVFIYNFHVTGRRARSNNFLLWRIKFLKFWSCKALRPPRLQFFTNSCRSFLALLMFCASFSRHLLPFALFIAGFIFAVYVFFFSSRYVFAFCLARLSSFTCLCKVLLCLRFGL